VRRQRFIDQYGLPEKDADILTAERGLSDYFETAVSLYTGDPKRVSNWLMNDVLRMINDLEINAAELKLLPAHLAEIIRLVDANTINISTGKSLLLKVQETGRAPADIVQSEGLAQVSDDSAIRAVAQAILDANPKEVQAYKGGKVSLMGWFVGQVMRQMHGKADPNLAREILGRLLA